MAGAEVVRELIAKLGVEFNKAQFAAADKAIEKVRWQMQKLVWSSSAGKFILPPKAAEGLTAVAKAATVAGASVKDVRTQLASLASGTVFGELGDKLNTVWEGAKLFTKGPVGIIAGIAAVGAGLMLAADKTAKYAGSMSRASQMAGVDVMAMQEMADVAKTAGIDLDALTRTMGHLSRSMAGTKKGSSESAKAFKELGIEVTDKKTGKLRAINDVMMDIADKTKAMGLAPDRAAKLMGVLGKSAQQMIPMLAQGSAEMRKSIADAHKFGKFVGADTLAQAKAYKKAKNDLGDIFEGLGRQLGAQFLPHLVTMAESLAHFVEKIQPVVKSGLDIFMQHVTAAFNTARVALLPLTAGLNALSALLNLPVSVKGGGLFASLIAGFKAVAMPILETYKAIEDLVYFVSGKGSRLGLSIATARGKQAEYVAGRKAGKSFDMQGNVIEPGAPKAPGVAGKFLDTAKAAGGKTMAGQAFQRGLDADKAGNWGQALLNYAGALGSLPTMIPDAIVRGYGQLADKIVGPSAGAAAGFKTPEYDWRDPTQGPQVSTEPRLPGYAPAGEWEKPVPVEVKVHVTADEGLKAQADQLLKRELRKVGR